MKRIFPHHHLRIRILLILALLAFLPGIILLMGDKTETLKTSITANLILSSVSIIPQSESLVKEDNSTGHTEDFIFQLGPIDADSSWYSYNGSYGGIQSGYDIGIGSDNITDLFIIRNMGTITIDITVAASDFDNSIKDDGNYLDTKQINGSLRIYIPGSGFSNIPDNDDNDEDKTKELTELCVADNLMINETIEGIDFQLRPPLGLQSDNYTGKIIFTTYDSVKINPCSGVGTYIIP